MIIGRDFGHSIIGRLRCRVELQSFTEAADSYGQKIRKWSTYSTIWARIETLAGRELLHAQQINAEVNHKIMIRYNSAISSLHRVKFGTKIFEINAIIPDEQNRYQDLYCKEIVD